jgi:hypothetical protein
MPQAIPINRETWQAELAERRHVDSDAQSNVVEPMNIRDIGDDGQAYQALMNALSAAETTDEQTASLSRHIYGLHKAASNASRGVGNPFLGESSPLLDDRRPAIMADPQVQAYLDSRDISGSHQELVEAWPRCAAEFTEGLHHGIELGYIPPEVEARLADTLHKTTIRMKDAAFFDDYVAAYSNSSDEVGLRHDFQAFGETIDGMVIHELTHKISGGSFALDAQSPEAYRNRVGFGTEMYPDHIVRTGLNEAVTEHIATAMLHGDFETLDPDQRRDGGRAYYEYRKLLATFVERSNGLMSVKTLTHAFYEDTGSDGSTTSRRKLVAETVQAYGYGALAKFDMLCESCHVVDVAHLEDTLLSRIHPQQHDAAGKVISRGWIDTSNLPTFLDIYQKARGTSDSGSESI